MVSSLADFATKLRTEKVQPFVQTEGALRDVHDAITEMMKQLANEPSVGLYFVQQHVHKAVPGLVSLKTQMVDTSREVEYVTQDVKDSLNSVKAMKEVGPAVIERMMKILDSAQPRLASLRTAKRSERTGHPQASSNRTGEPSSSCSCSHKKSKITHEEAHLPTGNSRVPVDSSSIYMKAQTLLNPHLLKRVFSEQVPLEKHISGQSTSAGDYSGYMKTTFDSALQKASSIANVTRWNSYNRGINLESRSSGGEESMGFDTKSEAHTESIRSVDAQDLLDTAHDSASSLRKAVFQGPTGTCTKKETVSAAKESQEVNEFSNPVIENTYSLLAFRDISDYGKPGQYVRAVLGSARQTAENVSKEATKFLSSDGRKPVPASEKPAEGWGWLQIPSNALRAFKQSQPSQDLMGQKGSGNTIIFKETSSSRSEEETQQLLDSERASYEAFAAEKAAKLEEWLQDTEEEDKRIEI